MRPEDRGTVGVGEEDREWTVKGVTETQQGDGVYRPKKELKVEITRKKRGDRR